jgi:hypothetical protein
MEQCGLFGELIADQDSAMSLQRAAELVH